MPFINGKKVRLVEARRAKGFDPEFGYSDAVKRANGADVEPEPEVVPEETKPKRVGSKKNEAEDALRAVTGLDINLGDEDEGEDNESE